MVFEHRVSPREEQALLPILGPTNEIGRTALGRSNFQYLAVPVRITNVMTLYNQTITN